MNLDPELTARILRHAARAIELDGIGRTGTVDGPPSLGALICRAHRHAGAAQHDPARCRAIQTTIAGHAGYDELHGLVHAEHDGEIVDRLLELAHDLETAR